MGKSVRSTQTIQEGSNITIFFQTDSKFLRSREIHVSLMDLVGKILARRGLERNSKVPKPRRAFTARSYRCRGRRGTGSLPRIARDPYFFPSPSSRGNELQSRPDPVRDRFEIEAADPPKGSFGRRRYVTERSDHTWRTREILRVRDDWRRETAVRNGTRRSSFVRSLSSRGSAPRLTTGEQQISIALTCIASRPPLILRYRGWNNSSESRSMKFRIESSRNVSAK